MCGFDAMRFLTAEDMSKIRLTRIVVVVVVIVVVVIVAVVVVVVDGVCLQRAPTDCKATAPRAEAAEAASAAAAEADVGMATHFVSHAWRYEYQQLVSALELFSVEQSNGASDNVFFWIDIFTIDQHAAANLSSDWFMTAFKDGVAKSEMQNRTQTGKL